MEICSVQSKIEIYQESDFKNLNSGNYINLSHKSIHKNMGTPKKLTWPSRKTQIPF